jgi:hypothetical protein
MGNEFDGNPANSGGGFNMNQNNPGNPFAPKQDFPSNKQFEKQVDKQLEKQNEFFSQGFYQDQDIFGGQNANQSPFQGQDQGQDSPFQSPFGNNQNGPGYSNMSPGDMLQLIIRSLAPDVLLQLRCLNPAIENAIDTIWSAYRNQINFVTASGEPVDTSAFSPRDILEGWMCGVIMPADEYLD